MGKDIAMFNRLAFIGALAGGLAHEIKNPLSSMNLNLQLLKEDIKQTPENEKLHKKIDIIQRESIRLEDILNDFLRFAKRKEPQLRLESPDEIVNEIVVFMAPEARQNSVVIKKESNADIPKALIDRNLFKQALLNIVINAEQAMPDGGELTIKISYKTGKIVFDILDNGKGIKPENIDKIYDIYYSTKSSGSGLGLATAKRIIEDHGGAISVTSKVNEGSCFTIEIPVNAGADN